MSESGEMHFRAAGFAARAHRHQLRKDGVTPYVSHVFRVCLVVRHVFGFDDERMLAAALLHDTIEDTNTDFDDIRESFGETVANWVATLTKETRLPDDLREERYSAALAAAPWQVKACKLADIYDNLGDCRDFPPEKRAKTAARSRRYLDALTREPHAELAEAVRLTEARLRSLQATLG